jgi:alpha-glucuronidase
MKELINPYDTCDWKMDWDRGWYQNSIYFNWEGVPRKLYSEEEIIKLKGNILINEYLVNNSNYIHNMVKIDHMGATVRKERLRV